MKDNNPYNLFSETSSGKSMELSLEDYSSLIQYLRLPAMVFDNDLHLVAINEIFQKVFQLTLQDLIKMGVQNFFQEDIWDRIKRPKEELSTQSTITSQLLETEFEQSGKFHKLTLTPIKNIHSINIGFLLFFIDMTREKMLEQVRADFTSMIVHDLRSPLTAIMGNLELLFMEFEDVCQEDSKELFHDSLEQSQRLLGLINDLLDISKIESGKFTLSFELIDPHEVVKYSVRSMEPLAVREKISLELSLEQRLTFISADKDKLVQVLINLISNAIKFTPAGGLVQIHTRLIDQNPNEKPYLLISVSDTGEGISREHLPRLFEKYQQVGKKKHKKIKGTGLGLFIVKELVEAHHGKVMVVSEYGHGSCFSLLFPINLQA